jgi:hypothetical protein
MTFTGMMREGATVGCRRVQELRFQVRLVTGSSRVRWATMVVNKVKLAVPPSMRLPVLTRCRLTRPATAP